MQGRSSSSSRRPRYAGEDTRLTSERELRGWYSYGIAAEVFAVCGVGSFLPVTLEQLAREVGVLRRDGITPCTSPAAAKARLGRRDEAGDTQCVIRLLGAEVNTSSFALYTFSAAVFVQAITVVSISAIADHGNHRKKFLLILGHTGAIACMLFILVVPQIYLLGSLLVIVSITCLGSSFVLLNSFLPLLVANHPSIREEGSEDTQSRSSSSHYEGAETEASTPPSEFDEPHDNNFELQDGVEFKSKQQSPSLHLSNRISSIGVGTGYAAAVLVQIFSIGILVTFSKLHLSDSSTLPMRTVLLLVGAWWSLFTLPTALWLRQRPGPALPTFTSTSRPLQHWLRWLPYLKFSWRSLLHTIKLALKLRQIALFLCAWFLLSDAIATVSGTAILFARTELHMGTAPIALISITAMVSGIAGAWAWPKISARLGLASNQTIIACTLLFELIPLYGLLAYFPPIRRLGWGGLQRAWEIYPLAFVHGFVMGGLSSFCRSFYGRLIPPGSEAAFYALYAVTDKGSSVIGPAVVGRIIDKTGSVRSGFWFLAVLILLPVPIVWRVDAERGRREALALKGGTRGEGESGDGDEEGYGLLAREA